MVPRSALTRYTPAKARSHWLGDEVAVGVGEIDAAVGLDDDVVGPVETAALEAVGDHRDAAVELLARHPPGVVLAGDQAALQVAREPVGAVGRAP